MTVFSFLGELDLSTIAPLSKQLLISFLFHSFRLLITIGRQKLIVFLFWTNVAHSWGEIHKVIWNLPQSDWQPCRILASTTKSRLTRWLENVLKGKNITQGLRAELVSPIMEINKTVIKQEGEVTASCCSHTAGGPADCPAHWVNTALQKTWGK